ncbi:MAG TPA: CSLREA domain-containing protein, partial [Anaerolineales bacterium]|nr:CSLREA domain-containing protein [Anaerolineales bacterium]
MTKRLARFFDIFVILTILISQFGMVSGAMLDAGAAPAPDLIPTSSSFAGVTISNVRINSGGNSGFVSPGSTFRLTMDYSIVDTGCPGCIDEIEIGFSTDSAPFTCIYTGIPGVEGTSGSAAIDVTPPSTPGIYYLGFDRAQHFSCGEALAAGWWSGAPDSSRYIASVVIATQVVTSAADTDDGFCNVDGCTLREAINAANTNEGLDVVVFNIPSES